MLEKLGPLTGPLRAHARLLFGAYVFALGAVCAGLLAPWALQLLIDHVLLGKPLPGILATWTTGLSATQWVMALCASVVVIFVAEALMTSQQRILTARVREGFTRDIRLQVLGHVFTLPPFTGTDDRSGELFTRLISDVNLVARLLTKTAPLLIRYASTAVLMLIILTWMAPAAALLITIALIPLGISANKHGRRLQNAMRRKRAADGEVAGLTQEIIAGLATVQAQGREPEVSARFGEVNARSVGAGVDATRTVAHMERSLRMGQGTAVALLMAVGSMLVLRGHITVGQLTVILAYATQLLKPIEKVNDVAAAVARGMAAGERLSQLMDRTPAVIEKVDATPLVSCDGHVTIDDVTFRYPSSVNTGWTIQNVSFHLEPNSLTVLAGRSGSGKSTLLHLLVRIFDPDVGRVLLDGVPLDEMRLRDIRRHVFLVRQHTHLFGGTWREVLCEGDEISETKLWDALSSVALDGRVRRLPQQLDTPLSENASNVSGGERRRISIARAFLRPCAVLLLDEPLAHIDVKSEAIIIEAIAQLCSRTTCLVASHRQSLLDRANHVYWLESGRIVRETHEPGPRSLAAFGG